MTALSAYRFSTITLESQPENCLIRQKTSGSQRNRRAPPELYEELSEFYKMVRNLHDRNSHEVDFVMRFGGEEYRVVVIPDVNNPSYSLRRSLSTPPELEKIGIHPRILEYLMGITSALILFVGDFGSGKTTAATTYMVNYAKINSALAISIEDPPEINCSGYYGDGRFCQIKGTRDTMPLIISDMMRATFDIMMISEIRTAMIAAETFRASVIGRPIVSTIHGRTIEDGLSRLTTLATQNMGTSDSAIESTMGLMSQTFRCAILMKQLSPTQYGAVDYIMGDKAVRTLILKNELTDLSDQRRNFVTKLTSGRPLSEIMD